MQTQADVVVIGAGAFGLSVAWHLADLGAGRVVVLDRHAPGSQTSPRAAGLFKLIQPDEARTRLSQLAIDIVTRFEQITGVPLSFVRSGSLMLARTPEHARMVRQEYEQSRAWGIELEMVAPTDVRRMMPAIESTDFTAACHTPGDIYIEEPAALMNAWLQALERLEVPVLGHSPVTGIQMVDGAIAGVVTPDGEIATPLVVDAAGAWARMTAALARSTVHVAPVRHQLYITDAIGGVDPRHPILRIVDSAVYVRPARGGLMLGGFESDPLPVEPREQPAAFTIDDVPLDMQVLSDLTATVTSHLPIFRDAPISEHRGGLFTMTPDGRFLAGPVAAVRGLWAATGCNGSGFSSSPAIGRVLAEWIVHGEPSIDLSPLAPSRFGQDSVDEERLRANCIWQYANYYSPAPQGDGQ